MSHKAKKDKTPLKNWTDVKKEIDGAGARRKEGSKPRASTATSGARPKPGFEKGHANPESGARPRDGKTNLPLESRRKDNLPEAVDIRKKF